eukprot:TRINITY_DN5751_c3_g1_i1.p1 TRINITY_DN5751_c3_g1~~TRINITY_DN5751_c3_g1_i1.p1  ORF type:complete len:663 (+),score=130.92 TRINITY_DN5751_c3_g1_i1:117-2105(+)
MSLLIRHVTRVAHAHARTTTTTTSLASRSLSTRSTPINTASKCAAGAGGGACHRVGGGGRVGGSGGHTTICMRTPVHNRSSLTFPREHSLFSTSALASAIGHDHIPPPCAGPDSKGIFKSPWPDIEIPRDNSVSEYVLTQARLHDPNRVAFVDGHTGREMTFGQFVTCTETIAGNLHKAGVQKGTVVLINTPNFLEYTAIVHAVFSLGAILSPSSPAYGAKEIEHQLSHSGATFVITSAPLLPATSEAIANCSTSAPVDKVFVVGQTVGNATLEPGSIYKPFADLLIASEADEKNNHKFVQERARLLSADDVAIIPYSSGTTGQPKGVLLTHRNLIANLEQICAADSVDSADVLIGVLPFYHIYGFMVICNMAVRVGCKLVVVEKFDFVHFLETLQNHKITRAHVAPPIIVALAKHPLVEKFDLSSLEMLFSGAAPLAGDVEDMVVKRLGCGVKQAYGMTEMSPASHCTPDGVMKKGSIGPLVCNTEGKLLDPATDEVLTVGQIGELCIRGPQIMKGYLQNDAATRQTMTDDGFLRTGDTGTVDKDGYWTVVDRVKELIKYKGFQVPPAELEAVLLTHPMVVDAAVVPVPDEFAGELPKAFVVLKPGADQPSESDIMEFVKNQVAAYKQIRMLEFITEIPKSAAGKILRRVLRDAEREKLKK